MVDANVMMHPRHFDMNTFRHGPSKMTRCVGSNMINRERKLV